MALIAVTDQGPGIQQSEQDRIFERFYRVDSARSRQTGGTGLGLSIVKHVMQQHGGRVDIWSEEGQGSTFTLCIPLMSEQGGGKQGQEDHADGAEGAAANDAEQAASGHRGRRPVRAGTARREGGESA